MKKRTLLVAGGALLAGLIAAAVYAWQPAIAPVAVPIPASLDQSSVARGARVAALGDCMVCHTSKDGQPYAGGLALRTPFGTIYTTNITPDPQHGIGDWSLAAFTRALRHGVARDGHLLYPAFPYIHYTRMSEQDIGDAYAYLMSRTPVAVSTPANELVFPLGFRPLLAGWNLLYLRSGPRPQQAGQSAQWNRGRYLVDGLGHCASCHSSLNLIGGEGSPAFGGGNIDGWDAPALTALLQPPKPWNAAQLALYLRHGWSVEHGAAAGPMAPVVHSLAQVPPSDTDAIAAYLMTLQTAQKPQQPQPPQSPQPPAVPDDAAALRVKQGAALFNGACASCHGTAAPMMATGGRPSLALSGAVTGERPDNLIQVVLNGLPWSQSSGHASYMPPFAATLTDAQIASIAMYLRSEIGQRPAWDRLQQRVTTLRKENQP